MSIFVTSHQPTDHQILELASRRYRRPGGRDLAARLELGLSSTQYARRLLAIVEEPSLEHAETHGPLIVRLQRLLEQGREKRSAA